MSVHLLTKYASSTGNWGMLQPSLPASGQSMKEPLFWVLGHGYILMAITWSPAPHSQQPANSSSSYRLNGVGQETSTNQPQSLVSKSTTEAVGGRGVTPNGTAKPGRHISVQLNAVSSISVDWLFYVCFLRVTPTNSPLPLRLTAPLWAMHNQPSALIPGNAASHAFTLINAVHVCCTLQFPNLRIVTCVECVLLHRALLLAWSSRPPTAHHTDAIY